VRFEVDQKAVPLLAHHEVAAAAPGFFVLFAGASPLAPLHDHMRRRQLQRLRRCDMDGRTPRRALSILLFGAARIFLQMRELAVAIQREGEFRDVAVVDAIALDAAAPGPLAQMARILAHAI
jgi:hypothetical protein